MYNDVKTRKPLPSRNKLYPDLRYEMTVEDPAHDEDQKDLDDDDYRRSPTKHDDYRRSPTKHDDYRRSPTKHDDVPRSPHQSPRMLRKLNQSQQPEPTSNSSASSLNLSRERKTHLLGLPSSTVDHADHAPIKNPDSTVSTMLWAVAVGILMLAIVLFFSDTFVSMPGMDELNPNTSLVQFKMKLKEMKDKFPTQSDDVWKNIRAAVTPIFKKEIPAQPAVLILISQEVGLVTLNCFARLLSDVVESSFESHSSYTHINGDELKQIDATKAKHKLHTNAVSAFDNGIHTYLVENIQHLPSESALIFHGLCDDQNAPYKQVAYIMTMILKEPVNTKTFEVTALWPGLKEDIRSSLESRIGAHKVFVKHSEDAELRKICST